MDWILLRGLAREARHWGDFAARLGAAFPGARIRTPDLPGNGVRCAQRTPSSISAIVDAVRQEGGPPAYLLGISLGAMACVDWAARFPGDVAGCVLINPSMRPFSAFHQRLRPANYGRLASLLLEGDPARREAGILALTSASASGTLARTWAGYAAERPVARRNVLCQLLAAARFRAPDRAPPVPVLVLASAADRLVDPQCSRSLAARWGVPIAEHPLAGHDLPLDAAPWVIEQTKRWLGGIP